MSEENGSDEVVAFVPRVIRLRNTVERLILVTDEAPEGEFILDTAGACAFSWPRPIYMTGTVTVFLNDVELGERALNKPFNRWFPAANNKVVRVLVQVPAPAFYATLRFLVAEVVE